MEQIDETVRQGGIQPLVAIMEFWVGGTLKTKATSALTNLSRSDEACHEMASKGNEAIALLVTLLHDGTEEQQKNAAAALASVDGSNMVSDKMREKVINPLIQLQQTGTDEQQCYASAALKNFARNDEIRTEIVRDRDHDILQSENGADIEQQEGGHELPKSEESLKASSENATSPVVQPPKDGCCTIL
ncbi:hypothetical protein PF003_g12325 [Phytophthora fragariae]|nr:hypothetical protein PF003_g12325 [Phytophthora fragariae]